MNVTTSEAYGAFALAYDAALGTRFFGAVRWLLIDTIQRYFEGERTHLDVACGTGHALSFFAAQGFDSVGADASLAMLGVARSRVGTRIPLVASDFRALPLRRTFGIVTCLYDSLNHMMTRDDLVTAFRAIARVMNERSVFAFDMNHPDVYPEVWGSADAFVSDSEDHHLEIATSFDRRSRTAFAKVSGWATLPDGRRGEIAEEHRQYSWTRREIDSCLADAGLAVLERRLFDPFDEADQVEAESVKLFYVCRRK